MYFFHNLWRVNWCTHITARNMWLSSSWLKSYMSRSSYTKLDLFVMCWVKSILSKPTYLKRDGLLIIGGFLDNPLLTFTCIEGLYCVYKLPDWQLAFFDWGWCLNSCMCTYKRHTPHPHTHRCPWFRPGPWAHIELQSIVTSLARLSAWLWISG